MGLRLVRSSRRAARTLSVRMRLAGGKQTRKIGVVLVGRSRIRTDAIIRWRRALVVAAGAAEAKALVDDLRARPLERVAVTNLVVPAAEVAAVKVATGIAEQSLVR